MRTFSENVPWKMSNVFQQKKTRLRFKVGCTTMYFSTKKFDSDETYNNFQKLIRHKNRLIDAERKNNSRKEKKIENFKDLVQDLKEREACDAAEYLQVL